MAKTKSARVKTPALAMVAPGSADQADTMVRRVGELVREKVLIQAALDEGIARLRTEAEAEAAPLSAEIANLTSAVQAWAEANRDDLTRGGRVKTHRMPSGEIAWRHLPPSVRITSPATVLELLQQMGLQRFVREKREIDREALKADPDTARTRPSATSRPSSSKRRRCS